MNFSPPAPRFARPVLHALVMAAVPLAALLAFLVQPMMGKRLLPLYGGTSGTWLGCMLFFQLTLLLGYAWAAWLVRKPARIQLVATLVLAAVAVATFHLPSDESVEGASILHVIWRLSLAALPAMVLLFSTSPLLHGWLRRQGDEVPYYLYAISNAGSLAGLVLYPFIVEPRLRMDEQRFFWHGLLVLLAGVMAVAGYLFRQSSESNASHIAPEADEPLRLDRILLWLWLSALTCAGMLAATYHLAAEIGSSPLAWVGPFGVYLLSFMIVFAGRWQRWMTMVAIAWLAISLSGYMVAKGFSAATVNASRAWWLLSLTAAGSFVGNAILHGARPAVRFERFYLVLAAGGVIGGVVSAMVIPYVLSHPIEFGLASAALLTTGLVWLNDRREPGIIAVVAIVVFVPVLALGRQQMHPKDIGNADLHHIRDLHGHILVKTDERSVVLSSDTTTHGTQLTMDAAARKRPTFYYSESTGVGRVIEQLKTTRPSMNVGIVGLGAGTIAAYARPGDTYDFWDIDPKSLRVARENFTFVSESSGKINLVQRDGRKALEESKTDYDLIVIDAFTGDGVPSHLLTREAIQHYFTRLSSRNGLLVVHTSTRYSQLFPVIEATARTSGLSALNVITDITDSLPERDWDPTHTEYVVVCRPGQLKSLLEWFPAEEDNGRVKRQVNTVDRPLIPQRLIWSDSRNAAVDALELGRFIFEP